MFAAQLTQQLIDFIRSLREQGILDDRFDQIKELEDENPGLVVEVLTVAIRSADFTIDELEKKLSGTVIYYSKVRELTHKLKGISAR
ncbi:hypothetical protein DVH24_005727 [Malus domestica]|uniref:Histidine-containing phosphotransfer protein n=1 Tax=Malus domestica TaxID=3750 RepID=A0A498IMQ7_MALDO|nr:hypothetical protein DVH24_005727 [Malus domestica]